MAESIPITDYKDLRTLRTHVHQERRLANSNLRPIYALDCETYNGNIILIADSEGVFLDNEAIKAESVISFLFQSRYKTTWNFFYNLGYDAEVILKLLGNSLKSYKKTGSLTFEKGLFKIEYIPNKKLAIRKGHHSTVFFDIAQYYHTSLANAYQQNIGKLPEDYLEMKKLRTEFSPRFYHRNKRKIRKYCIQDCIFTKKLAQHWIKLFHNAFSFYPARWISSGYLAEKVLINNKVDVPKFDSIPYKIQDLAFRSYFGGRFEILKRGLIGTAYLYDINSAYPYALTKIPDLTQGTWIKRKSIHKDAKLGFFKILAKIPDCKYIPPFPFRSNYIVVFPSGEFETYCTLEELKACDNSDYYSILDSYQFIPETTNYPFKEFVEKMYQKRMKLKQQCNSLELPFKIILNSIYGKTGQKVKGRIGNMFNPVLFSFITGFARAQLYKFVLDNKLEKEVVSFATDSICTTRNLDVDSDSLGAFSFDKSADDVFYLQNGFYRFNGTWKQRGLGHLGTKEIEHLDTFERDSKLFYRFKVLRSSRLRSSILQNKIADIGKIKTFVREVNLNADRKRFWLGNLSAINHGSNDSMPISLNYFII